jgi:hypothetical protein
LILAVITYLLAIMVEIRLGVCPLRNTTLMVVPSTEESHKKKERYKRILSQSRQEYQLQKQLALKNRLHVHYLVEEHLNRLTGFYNQDTAKDRWLNYLTKQKAIEETTNILINGGLKYNKERRRKRISNRKKRRRKKNRKHKKKYKPRRRATTRQYYYLTSTATII